MEVKTASGQGSLYEITQLFCADEDSVLCCTGLYDGSHALALFGENMQNGEVSAYTVQLLDLASGKMEKLASFGRTQTPGDMSDGTENLCFLSADPLIIYDRQGGILYRPELSGDPLVLPAYLRDAEPYWQDGHLWLSSDRGMIYEAAEDGAITVSWRLPCEYGAFTPVVCGHEGKLTFATYSRRDPSLQVYVDVSPVSGKSEYYLSDINPSRFSVFSDGLLLGSSFRTSPAVSVCDPEEHVKKEMELPDEVLSLISEGGDPAAAGNNGSFLAFSTYPLSLKGDWCSWALCDTEGRPAHVYLWDTASCKNAGWDGPTVSGYTAPETAEYEILSDRAKALEDKYGVRILFGTNIPTEFADYSAEPFTETTAIDGSLSVLENVLSLYPDSYFRSLKGNYYRDIVFYLTGTLSALNTENNISNAGAFATDSNGTMQLAFDLYDDLSPDTVIHELTHAADYRFAGEGIMDEEAWNSMNPAGFSYYYSYIDANGESYETSGSLENTAVSDCAPDDVWFIDPYSKTFPMEDRARLMENLLSGRTPYAECYSGKHIQEKLSYYFAFLRDTLGDDSWPAQTSWEEALAAALSD